MKKFFNKINSFHIAIILLVIIVLVHIGIILAPLGKYASAFEETDLIYFINIRQYAVQQVLSGIFPLWTTKIFCGVPFFANSECALMYLPNIIFYFLPISKAIDFSFLLHFFILSFTTFLWINNRIRDRSVSVIVAIVSVFGTNLYLHFAAGHLSNVITACWFPLLLYLYDKSFEKKKYFYIFPVSIIISLQVFAGHFQYVYYTALVSFVYVLLFCRNKYALVTLFSSYIISLFLVAVQLLPSYAFYLEGGRKINIFDTNASSICAKFKYLFSFVFYIQAYLPQLFWEKSNYMGTLCFVVIITTLFHIHDKNILKFFYVAIFLLSLTFEPIVNVADKIIPFFSWFRGPVKLNFFINILLLPILAEGIRFFLSKDFKINKLYILFLFACSVLIVVFREAVSDLLLTGFEVNKITISIINFSVKMTAVLIFIFSVLLIFKKYKISKIILILLLVAEPLIIARFHLNPVCLKQDFKYEYITREPFNEQPRFSAYRNFNLLYDAENISGLYSDRLGNFGVFSKKTHDTKNENILGLLRSKYNVDLRTSSIKKSDNKTLNRINFYYDYTIETDKSEIYKTLYDKDFDIFNTVVLEKEPQYKPDTEGEYSLNVLNFNENSIEFEFNTTEPTIVLYTDNYSKGWKAYEIDNPKQEYEVVCADYLYKAISVDKGNHKIRIEYKPTFFIVGLWISVAAWIVFISFFVLFYIRKKQKPKTTI
ncbi:MAG: YfhO family protein [Elusimicrobia bacterium]|nr:YfhO family protein [Elusimicrobiota bacterium]